MIKLLSKNSQERVWHRAASAAPIDQLSEASMASAVIPWESHQTLPQARSRRTGGHLKLRNHFMGSAITFISWDQAIFRSSCVGEVLIPSPFFQGWKAPAPRQLFEMTTSSNVDFHTPLVDKTSISAGPFLHWERAQTHCLAHKPWPKPLPASSVHFLHVHKF